jgi:co-chaperonin GroES (HSP10)
MKSDRHSDKARQKTEGKIREVEEKVRDDSYKKNLMKLKKGDTIAQKKKQEASNNESRTV